MSLEEIKTEIADLKRIDADNAAKLRDLRHRTTALEHDIADLKAWAERWRESQNKL